MCMCVYPYRFNLGIHNQLQQFNAIITLYNLPVIFYNGCILYKLQKEQDLIILICYPPNQYHSYLIIGGLFGINKPIPIR